MGTSVKVIMSCFSPHRKYCRWPMSLLLLGILALIKKSLVKIQWFIIGDLYSLGLDALTVLNMHFLDLSHHNITYTLLHRDYKVVCCDFYNDHMLFNQSYNSTLSPTISLFYTCGHWKLRGIKLTWSSQEGNEILIPSDSLYYMARWYF